MTAAGKTADAAAGNKSSIFGACFLSLSLTACAAGLSDPATDYGYVDAARELGDAGFEQILAGEGAAARELFMQSTATLAEGITEHSALIEQRAGEQRMAANILTGALVVASTLAAVAASSQGYGATQYQVADSYEQLLTSSLQFGHYLHEEIALAQASIVDGRALQVDSDAWRAVVLSTHPIADSVVRIENLSAGGLCTGFFVQPNLVMTSAHCFSLGDSLIAKKHDMGSGANYIAGHEIAVPLGHQFISTLYDEQQTCHPMDVAFLTTEQPNGSYLPIALDRAELGTPLMQLGYSGDLNQGFFLRLDYGCEVTSLGEDGVLRTNCATYGGNSGGPILAVPESEAGISPTVIAVHSCGVRESGRRDPNRAGAVAIGNAAGLYEAMLELDDLQGFSADPTLFH